MDIKGYNKGVADLPERMRLYARTMNGVTITLNREQALLLADDIERGIEMRSASPQTPQTPKPQVPKAPLWNVWNALLIMWSVLTSPRNYKDR